MKLSHSVLMNHNQKAHRLLDRRSAERVPILVQISYARLEDARIVTAEGTLKDLSKTGCKILESAPSSLGSSLTLVYLEKRQAPCASPTSPSPDRQRIVCRQIPEAPKRRAEAAARGHLEKYQRIVLRQYGRPSVLSNRLRKNYGLAKPHHTSPVLTLRNMVRAIQAACIVGLGVLSGCASILPPSPLTPFLAADSADVKLIEALAHEQYTRVENCHERKSCLQDHYTRGLIALFQSRERAVASFQQVKSLAPNSRLANLSTSWIDLLQASGSSLSFLKVQSADVLKVTEDFVWEALVHELHGANESV